MKSFEYTSQFKKLYKRLPQAIQKKVKRQLNILAQDIRHPSLGVKKMENKKNIWEARVDIQYRITFKMQRETITLRAVGTHEIYRKF